MPSTINLRNSAWHAGVRVEAHQGINQDPDLNPSLGIQVIRYDEAWPIISAVNVQWRREVDPPQPQGNGPNGIAFLLTMKTTCTTLRFDISRPPVSG